MRTLYTASASLSTSASACATRESRSKRSLGVPAAALRRVSARANGHFDANARVHDACEYLADLYAEDSAREERLRQQQREAEAMEDLGLPRARDVERAYERNKRDISIARSYGVTRVNFGAMVECAASASTVYEWWTTPAALAETLPELTRCEVVGDGARARCEWAYALGDVAKLRGREAVDSIERHLSVVKATETAPGSSVTYEATAGMPVGGVVTVVATGANSCTLDVDAWVHFPISLTSDAGTMAVSMDAQNKFFDALKRFKETCATGGAAERLRDIKDRARAGAFPGDRVEFDFTH